MQGKEFATADVFTAVTGFLLVDESGYQTNMDAVYAVLNFMCGDNFMTHQLPRAKREVEIYAKEWFPHLFNMPTESWRKEASETNRKRDLSFWLEKRRWIHDNFGETTLVMQIPQDDHDIIDPIQEIIDMGFEDKLIIVDMEDEDDSISPYGTLPSKS